MKVIALVNQKGGVAKTTSAVNLSSCLSEMGHSVLAVDLDAQGNLGYNFGLDTENLDKTIYDVLAKDTPASDIVHKTNFGVDVIPSNILLANAEIEISSKMSRETILKNAFKKAGFEYDFVILDLPPNLSLITLNGLSLADYAIVPLDAGIFSLAGMNQLISVIQLIKENGLNPDLDILGVVLTKVDARTNLSKEIYDTLKEIFGDKVFETQIHQNIKIAESQKEQKPINFYAPENRGSKEYRSLAKELIEYVNR